MKPKQVFYRLYYAAKKRFVQENVLLELPSNLKAGVVASKAFLSNKDSYSFENEFSFLNLSHSFDKEVDWNYNAFGKLWTYNLCYFDFLLQDSLTKEEGLSLILNFRENYSQVKDGLESYPSSLRIMNCIKFVAKHQIEDQALDQLIYSDMKRVSNNLEYHLLGNHLLENAFALLIGAIYFSDEALFSKVEKLLKRELEEQILPDGGHYELSPMYHQIMLSRALDGVNLMSSNDLFKSGEMRDVLLLQTTRMLAWLSNITFNSGEVPMLNDSAQNIAPNSSELREYASRLSINISEVKLKESGYRKRIENNYEFLCDVGNIGPDYIPGHAHSDTFNFVINYKNNPLIVDTGISTYEKNELRHAERATAAHNTVMVNNMEQSDMWGGFRVGKRAKIIKLEEEVNGLKAAHNGYKQLGVIHQRHFSFLNGNILIKDQLSKVSKAKAYIHFHPSVKVLLDGDKVLGDFGEIKVSRFEKIALKKYNFAEGFNKKVDAMVIEIEFTKELNTEIRFA